MFTETLLEIKAHHASPTLQLLTLVRKKRCKYLKDEYGRKLEQNRQETTRKNKSCFITIIQWNDFSAGNLMSSSSQIHSLLPSLPFKIQECQHFFAYISSYD